jgi:probable phosphoglycerate mutase
MERNQGLWDGLNAEQIERDYRPDPRLRRTWEFAAPGGETLSALHARIASWLGEVPEDRMVVAVCHGVVSRVMRGAYLALTPDAILALPGHPQDRIFKLAGGSLSELICK